MNNVIKPDTYIKILSQEHLTYIKSLVEGQGYRRWGSMTSESDANYINFHEDMDYTLNGNKNLSDSEEIFIPMPEASPTPPFKLRNANHPAVRQWLKDMGYITLWDSRPLDNLNMTVKYIRITDEGKVDYWDGVSDRRGFLENTDPELTLNLAVTSWSMPEPIDKVKLERMERIKAIEAELDKLKQMDA